MFSAYGGKIGIILHFAGWALPTLRTDEETTDEETDYFVVIPKPWMQRP